ncbi:hypothetical protein FGO68_gene2822 [Halteria grandinella]|uniref:Uncharacterized protein n=1 Tax=Halteria grandinella TaxID=5974 RepID=A0A8J8NS99_HALGN|nr:hypothetical protein FGO68_gene2822 [Halteria grandinella]
MESKGDTADKAKSQDFIDLIFKKLGDEIGLDKLATNGGLVSLGKWEETRQITIPQGLKSFNSTNQYLSGRCLRHHLAKSIEIDLRPIREMSIVYQKYCDALIEHAEINFDKGDFKVNVAFTSPSGTMSFLAAQWELSGEEKIYYRIIYGDVSFDLIPARTLIIEQQHNTYFFGLASEYNTRVTEYVNPITLDNIRGVLQFMREIMFDFSQTGSSLSIKNK